MSRRSERFVGKLQSYELEELLYPGGSSEIWKARGSVKLDECCVKLAKHGRNEGIRNELRRFSRLWEQDQRGSGAALDGGESPRPFLVLRLFEGNLRAWMGRSRLVELRLRAMAQLASLVDALGRVSREVHLDIKPENILWTEHEDGSLHIELCDFEETRLLSPDGTAAGTGAGTPEYQSWDGRLRRRVTTAVDAFAVGVIVFEVLVGQRPEIVVKHGTELTKSGRRLLDLTSHRLGGALHDDLEREIGSLGEMRDQELVNLRALSPPLTSQEEENLRKALLPRGLGADALVAGLRMALCAEPARRRIDGLTAALRDLSEKCLAATARAPGRAEDHIVPSDWRPAPTPEDSPGRGPATTAAKPRRIPWHTRAYDALDQANDALAHVLGAREAVSALGLATSVILELVVINLYGRSEPVMAFMVACFAVIALRMLLRFVPYADDGPRHWAWAAAIWPHELHQYASAAERSRQYSWSSDSRLLALSMDCLPLITVYRRIFSLRWGPLACVLLTVAGLTSPLLLAGVGAVGELARNPSDFWRLFEDEGHPPASAFAYARVAWGPDGESLSDEAMERLRAKACKDGYGKACEGSWTVDQLTDWDGNKHPIRTKRIEEKVGTNADSVDPIGGLRHAWGDLLGSTQGEPKRDLRHASAILARLCADHQPLACTEQGRVLLARGLGEEGAAVLRNACETDVRACALLGEYEIAHGQDDGIARLEAACSERSDPVACAALGSALLHDGASDNDLARARGLLSDACLNDGAVATGCWGLSQYHATYASPENPDQAVRMAHRACEAGSFEGCVAAVRDDAKSLAGFTNARSYLRNNPAFGHLEEICGFGNVSACRELGDVMSGWNGILPRDLSDGETWYHEACSLGDERACVLEAEASRYLRESCDALGRYADSGDILAARLASFCHAYDRKGPDGTYDPPDFTRARTYARMACDGRDVAGCKQLAKLLTNDEPWRLDQREPELALWIEETKCLAGEVVTDSDAARSIMYCGGPVASDLLDYRDKSRARAVLEVACQRKAQWTGSTFRQQDNEDPCARLAVLLRDGANGVPADLAAARKAADDGCSRGKSLESCEIKARLAAEGDSLAVGRDFLLRCQDPAYGADLPPLSGGPCGAFALDLLRAPNLDPGRASLAAALVDTELARGWCRSFAIWSLAITYRHGGLIPKDAVKADAYYSAYCGSSIKDLLE